MNSFQLFGGVLAAWAVVVSVLGFASPRFPGKLGEKLVMGISVVLVVLTVGAAIYTAAEEKKEHEEAAALVAP